MFKSDKNEIVNAFNIKKQKVLYLVLSFDDTHYLNKKCANLLDKYNLRGTFYYDVARISNFMVEDIRWISERHEVGSHGMTHRDLTKLTFEELMYECGKSKESLEKLIGKPVNSFAYPYGFFNEKVRKVVMDCGYLNARTFMLGNTDIDDNTFALRVTLGATSYGYRKIPFFVKSVDIYELLYNPWLIRRWDKLVDKILKKLLSESKEKGKKKILHIVFHADFIELKNEWDKLEEVLSIFSSSTNTKNLTVSEYAKILRRN